MIDRLQNLAKLKLTESDFGIQLQSFTNSISLEIIDGLPELVPILPSPIIPEMKMESQRVEFNYYYFWINKPNPLSGIL